MTRRNGTCDICHDALGMGLLVDGPNGRVAHADCYDDLAESAAAAKVSA